MAHSRLLLHRLPSFTVSLLSAVAGYSLSSLSSNPNKPPSIPHLSTHSLLLSSLNALLLPQVECSPTYNGVPVAATFLMHQAFPIFQSHFPGLEMSPIFTLRDEGTSIESKSINELHLFSFSENNGSVSALFYPTECIASVPVFEKKGQREEALMGAAGIRKTPVGKLVMKGKCKFGCATVQLVEMWIEKINDIGTDGRSEGPEKVWEWRL